MGRGIAVAVGGAVVVVGDGQGVAVVVGVAVGGRDVGVGIVPLEDPHALISNAPRIIACMAFTA